MKNSLVIFLKILLKMKYISKHLRVEVIENTIKKWYFN